METFWPEDRIILNDNVSYVDWICLNIPVVLFVGHEMGLMDNLPRPSEATPWDKTPTLPRIWSFALYRICGFTVLRLCVVHIRCPQSGDASGEGTFEAAVSPGEWGLIASRVSVLKLRRGLRHGTHLVNSSSKFEIDGCGNVAWR